MTTSVPPWHLPWRVPHQLDNRRLTHLFLLRNVYEGVTVSSQSGDLWLFGEGSNLQLWLDARHEPRRVVVNSRKEINVHSGVITWREVPDTPEELQAWCRLVAACHGGSSND